MEALSLYSIMAICLGALLAWFHRGSFLNLFFRVAILALLLMGLTVLLLEGPPKHYSPKYLLEGLAYFIVPYVLYLLIPASIAAALTLFIRRRHHRKIGTEMTTRFIILIATLLGATEAFAHPPYEVAAGSFTRSDGVIISAVEHYVDGILGTDPVSVQFRLPDGSVIAQTERTRDSVVVRSTSLGIEVYRFQTDWIPFASSVERFDGFSLSDTSSRPPSFLSALVHTRAHLWDYAVVLTLVGVLVGCWFAARAMPKRGWLAVMRVVGFVTVAFAFGLFVLLVLFAVPVSPFIVCAFGGIIAAAGFAMRRFVFHARAD